MLPSFVNSHVSSTHPSPKLTWSLFFGVFLFSIKNAGWRSSHFYFRGQLPSPVSHFIKCAVHISPSNIIERCQYLIFSQVCFLKKVTIFPWVSYSPGWSQIHYIAKDGPKYLLPLLKCWAHRHGSLCLVKVP